MAERTSVWEGVPRLGGRRKRPSEERGTRRGDRRRQRRSCTALK